MFPTPSSSTTATTNKRTKYINKNKNVIATKHYVCLFSTNDLHSHCHRYVDLENTVQQQQQQLLMMMDDGIEYSWLWIDAGDWFSGTIYSCLGPNPSLTTISNTTNAKTKPIIPIAPEIEFFKTNHIIAGLGNHEFDAQCEGLVIMLEKAQVLGYYSFVSTDLEYDIQHENGKRMLNLMTLNDNTFTITEQPTTTTTKSTNKNNKVVHRALLHRLNNHIQVGIVAFMGNDARRGCAAATTNDGGISFASWSISKQRGRELVAKLRAAGANLVIVIVHGGLQECMELKKNIGADFAVSGHTHERLIPSSIYPVVQAESYGNAIGVSILDPLAASDVVVSGTIVSTTSSPLQQHHPSYYTTLIPYFAQQFQIDLNTSIPLSTSLPRGATLPLTRKENDLFAQWFCTVIRDEINLMLPSHIPHIDGFFIANELIRGDLSKCKDHKTDLSHLMSCFEVGMTHPQHPGLDIVIIETTRSALKRLWLLFYLASRLYTENAVPAYSEDFFRYSNHSNTESTTTSCYVATTLFMAKSMELVPGFIFDVKRRIYVLESVVMSVLVGKYLSKVGSGG
jgi:hypothetical protein